VSRSAIRAALVKELVYELATRSDHHEPYWEMVAVMGFISKSPFEKIEGC
jgi:hypothetical protein